jgi:predicted nucleic acid-binding protein
MSTRLQVLLDEEELASIRRIAKARHLTVSDWVRQSLRAAQREYPATEAGRKVQAVREAARHSYPTTDMDGMLREIEKGYSGGHDALHLAVMRRHAVTAVLSFDRDFDGAPGVTRIA